MITPVYSSNYIALAMSSSDEYAPYTCVYLKSIYDNSDENHNYDIVIFTSSMSAANKKRIICEFKKKNFSIRFYNPIKFFKNKKLSITHSYFSQECYFRLVVPLVFKNYERIVFTDIDLIATVDIFAFNDFTFDNHALLACKEPIWDFYLENNTVVHGRNIRKYTQDVLKTDCYYNTGVVVFNIPYILEKDFVTQFFNELDKGNFLYQEQDILNKVLVGNIKDLDCIWNYELDLGIELNSNKFLLYKKYKEQKKNAKIFHFLGRIKPWMSFNEEINDIWWYYAKRTSCYERILLKNFIDYTITPRVIYNQKISIVSSHYYFYTLLKYFYIIMKKIKKTKKYEKKLVELSSVLNKIKQIKKML